jgi:hypothetical protein
MITDPASGPIAGAGLPGLLLGGRWSSRLAATALERRLSGRFRIESSRFILPRCGGRERGPGKTRCAAR